MKPRSYYILSQCIENGVRRGWRQGHKHVESPSEDYVMECIDNCVMGEILTYFSFDDEDKE